ncbi:MAG: hypothetical protein KAT70_03815, partial [Thermoplasmata archaeon]|nr:hypothetical protein [Thermoplasmata archaeon]
SAKIVVDGGNLYTYMNVTGTLFGDNNDPNNGDTYRVFIDSDKDPTTGYYVDPDSTGGLHVNGIGADYMIEAWGFDGNVSSAIIYSMAPTTTDDWNAWADTGSEAVVVINASSPGSMVIQANISEVGGSNDVLIVLNTADNTTDQDLFDYIISGDLGATTRGTVTANLTSTAPYVLSDGVTTEMAQADLETRGNGLTVNDVNVRIDLSESSIILADIQDVRIYDSAGLVGQLGITAAPGSSLVPVTIGVVLAVGVPNDIYVAITLSGAGSGEAIVLTIESLSTSDGTYSIDTDAISRSYVDAVNTTYLVADGLLGEWSAFQGDPDDATIESIDMFQFSADIDTTTLGFYVDVQGTMGLGIKIPANTAFAGVPDGIPVGDDEPPAITDETDSEQQDGANAWYNATITDNIAITDVYVEYSVDGGAFTNVSMIQDGPDHWYYDDGSAHGYCNITYFITAVDWNGNWANVSGSIVFTPDGEAWPGGPATIFPEIVDSSEMFQYISDIWMNYSIIPGTLPLAGSELYYTPPGGAEGLVNSTTTETACNYMHTNNQIGIANYRISAWDNAFNFATASGSITQYLQGAPRITDNTVQVVTVGAASSVTFNATVDGDADTITNVSVCWNSPGGIVPSGNTDMTLTYGDATSGVYLHSIAAPTISGIIEYYFYAIDDSANENNTLVFLGKFTMVVNAVGGYDGPVSNADQLFIYIDTDKDNNTGLKVQGEDLGANYLALITSHDGAVLDSTLYMFNGADWTDVTSIPAVANGSCFEATATFTDLGGITGDVYVSYKTISWTDMDGLTEEDESFGYVDITAGAKAGRVSNRSSSGFVVSWTTTAKVTGNLSVGGINYYDIRDPVAGPAAYSGTTHYVLVFGLNPSTGYDYDMYEGGVMTASGSTSTLSSSSPLQSYIVYGDLDNNPDETIVYVTVNGYTASTLVRTDGPTVWSMNIGGDQIINLLDPITLEMAASDGGTIFDDSTYQINSANGPQYLGSYVPYRVTNISAERIAISWTTSTAVIGDVTVPGIRNDVLGAIATRNHYVEVSSADLTPGGTLSFGIRHDGLSVGSGSVDIPDVAAMPPASYIIYGQLAVANPGSVIAYATINGDTVSTIFTGTSWNMNLGLLDPIFDDPIAVEMIASDGTTSSSSGTITSSPQNMGSYSLASVKKGFKGKLPHSDTIVKDRVVFKTPPKPLSVDNTNVGTPHHILVTNLSDRTFSVVFTTSLNYTSRVGWADIASPGAWNWTAQIGPDELHKHDATGLDPGTTYYYIIDIGGTNYGNGNEGGSKPIASGGIPWVQATHAVHASPPGSFIVYGSVSPPAYARISDITDSSFVVSWTSSAAVTGNVSIGTNDYYDIRDGAGPPTFSGTVHYVKM